LNWFEERVAAEGRVLPGNVLKVDAFLNQQVDMPLMRRLGDAFADAFRDAGIDRVATVEASGIAPAGMCALALGVPLVILKKRRTKLSGDDTLATDVVSYTKNETYTLTVSGAYLPPGDRVLFIDDFLAMGEAALGAARLIAQAGAVLAGIGIVIEKSFQPGRAKAETLGVPILSLARIASMSAEPGGRTVIRFADTVYPKEETATPVIIG